MNGRLPTAAVSQQDSSSISAPHRKDVGERLFDEYLKTFREAPEAGFLLKEYFFDKYFDKEHLQDNLLFIPRNDFLWFFTYYIDEDKGTRTIELKKRSTSIAQTEVEIATIHTRRHYTFEEGGADILYTRIFEGREGEEFIMANTNEAVAHVEQLLVDFRSDRVMRHPY